MIVLLFWKHEDEYFNYYILIEMYVLVRNDGNTFYFWNQEFLPYIFYFRKIPCSRSYNSIFKIKESDCTKVAILNSKLVVPFYESGSVYAQHIGRSQQHGHVFGINSVSQGHNRVDSEKNSIGNQILKCLALLVPTDFYVYLM